MAQRRGAGEGSVFRGRNGWVGKTEGGRHPTTGKRIRIKRSGKTKGEVLRKLAEARKHASAGRTAGGDAALGAFLENWLTSVVAHRVNSLNTVSCYTQVVRLHVTPALGTVPVTKLTPEMVDRFLAAKAAAGLSKNYVSRMRSVLADALTHAERRGTVTRNVGRLAQMPRCEPTPEGRALTADEARALLVASEDERLSALVATGLMLGLRPGELTGLLWTDIDLDSGSPTLSVTGSMKRQPRSDGTPGYELVRGEVKRSTSGKRTIGLPLDLGRRLRDHRRRQAVERLAMGELWQDNGLVFSSELGTALDPSNFRRILARAAKRAGLDPQFPYRLRHTAASLLIDAGIPVEQVADLLGDDPRTLYRFYRHRVRPVVDAAKGPMQDLFGDAAG